MHGVAAMAVSHYRHPDVPRTWDHVPLWMNDTLEEFHNKLKTQKSLPRHDQQPMLWNLNLPAIDPTVGIPALVRCGIDTEPITRQTVLNEQGLRFESDFHARPRESGLDVEWCFTGHMTLSELSKPVRF
jgi:5'-nucleotidase